MATATPIHREATAAIHEGWNLPEDAFVEVLLRLPPNSRRRFRLVCRHWRDVINERTPVRQSGQPKALAFVVKYDGYTKVAASAYVIDYPAKGRCRELWRGVLPYWRRGKFDTAMVGTSNGLLCLCDNTKPGGAVSLVKPATGETLAVPPLPYSDQWARTRWGTMLMSEWHRAYSFAYLPTTEQYKIVHVPCYLDQAGGFNAVQVFTLGTTSPWRDVPVPGASCRLAAGIVSVDGAVYWVTKDTERVVKFDLKEERVASTMPLPASAGPGRCYHLTEVDGSLGVVARAARRTPTKIEVWVPGYGRDRQGWSRRYSVQLNGVEQWITHPHFAHGDYVLMMNGHYVVGHRLRNAGKFHRGEVRSVRISERSPGVAVSGMSGGRLHGMFTYVEATEHYN